MQDFFKKDIQQEEICFSHRYYSYISGIFSHIHHIPLRTTPLQQPVLNKQVQVRNRLFHAVSCQADMLCTVDAGPFKTKNGMNPLLLSQIHTNSFNALIR